MKREDFIYVAEETLDSLPEEFRDRIQNVAIFHLNSLPQGTCVQRRLYRHLDSELLPPVPRRMPGVTERLVAIGSASTMTRDLAEWVLWLRIVYHTADHLSLWRRHGKNRHLRPTASSFRVRSVRSASGVLHAEGRNTDFDVHLVEEECKTRWQCVCADVGLRRLQWQSDSGLES
jgi:hypothetical protein